MTGTALLAQFLFRISFGLAVGMACTSPRQVTGGYYRNHLYVLLGLNVLGSLVAWSAPEQFAVWPPLVAAILSYLGSVAWLYAKAGPGWLALVLIAAVSLWGAWLGTPATTQGTPTEILRWLDPPTSGLVLGFTLAAMFLGHWYLNTPSMALAPLMRLIRAMEAALIARAIVCGLGLALEIAASGWPGTEQTLFLLLRWLSGLGGAYLLAIMAYKTLLIPNTQSATGILYVGVIATFLGELVSLLISSGLNNPV